MPKGSVQTPTSASLSCETTCYRRHRRRQHPARLPARPARPRRATRRPRDLTGRDSAPRAAQPLRIIPAARAPIFRHRSASRGPNLPPQYSAHTRRSGLRILLLIFSITLSYHAVQFMRPRAQISTLQRDFSVSDLYEISTRKTSAEHYVRQLRGRPVHFASACCV